MRFYKIYDVMNDDTIYVNSESLEYYTYNEKYVELNLSSGDYIHADKSDFENMMFLEGAREY